MPTPKELTASAVAMGVAGVDLNTIAVSTVNTMEQSGQYYGPYDPLERDFLEKYLIEEITPDRIDYCRSWLANYQSPILTPLILSNSSFYAGDGPNTPIGVISGLKAGSTISVLADSRVAINGVNVSIGETQASPTTFSVTFRESWYGIVTRDTTFNFSVILNPDIVSGAIRPPFIGPTGQVFSPSIRYNQVILPAFISANTIVASPTVVPGAVNVSPPLIAATTSVFSPTVTQAAGYDPDAQAYITGYAPSSSTTFQDALNAFIVGIKADGLWSLVDWLLVPADTSSGFQRNVRNLAKTASSVNSPVFTAYRGFMGDGASAFVDIGEPLAASGNLFSQNDATAGIYINMQTNTNNVAVMGNVGTTRRHMIQARQSGAGSTQMQLNSATASNFETNPATKVGHKMITRPDSATLKGFVNGSLVVTQANSSTGTIGGDNGCLLRSTTSYSADRVALFYSGSSFSDTQAANMNSRVSTFLTAIGAN